MNSTRSRSLCATNRKPSRTGVPPAGLGAGENICAVRSPATPNNIAANEMPFKINNQPVPNGPTNADAIAGPKMRDPVMTAVLRLIALDMSASGTNSVTRALRAGLSIAPTRPSIAVSRNTIGTLMFPVKSQMPSNIACSAISDWVASVMCRRLNLSDSAPAQAPSNNIGRNCSAVLMPSVTALPVRRYNRNEVAVSCNHEPTLEKSKPRKNSRAL